MAELKIRGARQNNLRGVDLDLPQDRLIALTGVSGSGKSSLALDTLHAEGRRRYVEALSPALRRALGTSERPDFDAVQGLRPTVALTQHARTPSARESVAMLADIYDLLRVLFGRAGTLVDPETGDAVTPLTHDAMVTALMALPQGTRLEIEAPLGPPEGVAPDALVGLLDEVARAGFPRVRHGLGPAATLARVEALRAAVDLRPPSEPTPLSVVVDRVKVRPDRRDRLFEAVRTAASAGRGHVRAVWPDGQRDYVDRPLVVATGQQLPELSPRLLDRRTGLGRCPACTGAGTSTNAENPDTPDETEPASGAHPCAACDGLGLRAEARAVRWQDIGFGELLHEPIDTLAERLATWPRTAVTELVLDELAARVALLQELGLGYLPPGRSAAHLSRGERQRLRLIKVVGSGLSGLLYVFDEPTAGLHPSDRAPVVSLLQRLRDRGNTVLVVEHAPSVLRAADWIVDFGPGPGERGGRVLFAGPREDLAQADTPTARWIARLDDLPSVDSEARDPSPPTLALRGLRTANLRDLDIDLPLSGLVALTGPSGAGKSTLLRAACAHARAHDRRLRVLQVDDRRPARAHRSSPATYVGLWGRIRELLAATRESQVRGFTAGTFSLNTQGGRCEVCRGAGVQRVARDFLPDAVQTCPGCEGRRFSSDVLEVRWKGLDARRLLELTVEAAARHFADQPRLGPRLGLLRRVGLGYLRLGQPLNTLSGGEAQRLRLARELSGGEGAGVLIGLDEPTVGLHPQDVHQLGRALRELVEAGATVWIATHDPQLTALAHHVIELGPGAGPHGGRCVYAGPPKKPPTTRA